MNELVKKKQIATKKCPLCDKEVIIPDDLKSWNMETLDEKELERVLEKELQENVDKIIEFLNHSEWTSNTTKRASVMLFVIRRIIQNTFTTNYHRLGMLNHLMYEIHRLVELHEVSKHMQKKAMKKQGGINEKTDLTYVS